MSSFPPIGAIRYHLDPFNIQCDSYFENDRLLEESDDDILPDTRTAIEGLVEQRVLATNSESFGVASVIKSDNKRKYQAFELYSFKSNYSFKRPKKSTEHKVIKAPESSESAKILNDSGSSSSSSELHESSEVTLSLSSTLSQLQNAEVIGLDNFINSFEKFAEEYSKLRVRLSKENLKKCQGQVEMSPS